MDIKFNVRDNTLIIKLGQELDHHNANFIKAESEKYICRYKIQDIIFDFAKTHFMDSSGIGVIMGRYKVIKGLDGKISVVNVNDTIERIFVISGLYKLVDRYATISDAIR